MVSPSNAERFAAGMIAEARIKLEAAEAERIAGRWVTMLAIVWDVETGLNTLRRVVPSWHPDSAISRFEWSLLTARPTAARGAR